MVFPFTRIPNMVLTQKTWKAPKGLFSNLLQKWLDNPVHETMYCTFRFGEWLVYKPDGGAICEDKVYCKRFDNWHWWPSHQRCYRQFSQGPCRKGSKLTNTSESLTFVVLSLSLGSFSVFLEVLEKEIFTTELWHFVYKILEAYDFMNTACLSILR